MFRVAAEMSCAENQRIDADKQIPSTGRLPNLPSRILIHLRNQVEDRKVATKKKSPFGMRGTATDVILLVKITAVAINLFVSGSLHVVSEATPTFPHCSLFDRLFCFLRNLLQPSRDLCTARFSMCSLS